MLEAVAVSGGAYNLDDAEGPERTGRAVVALATDPNVMARTGQALAVAKLAHEYGFTEDDGSQPPLIEIA